jgi:hypothetical protein
LIINLRHTRPPKENYFYCGRPGPLGNPFDARIYGRVVAVRKYEPWLREQIEHGNQVVIEALKQLTLETTLGCWCDPLLCHCSIIKKVVAEGIINHAS